MPAKKKAAVKLDPIAVHAQLRDEAVEAVDDAAAAVEAAADAYLAAVQYAKATEGVAKPETIDVQGARIQHSRRFASKADKLAGRPSGPKFKQSKDPRNAFRRFAAVKNARF